MARGPFWLWLTHGQGPLSPNTDIPWATLVALAGWLLLFLVGRPATRATSSAGELVAVWLIATVSFLFYVYKFVEVLYMLYAPGHWWIKARRTKRKKRRRVFQGITFLDTVELILPYLFAAATVAYATYETFPESFPDLARNAPLSSRIVELLLTSALYAYGGSSELVFPFVLEARIILFLLTQVQYVISTIAIGTVASAAYSLAQRERQWALQRPRKARGAI